MHVFYWWRDQPHQVAWRVQKLIFDLNNVLYIRIVVFCSSMLCSVLSVIFCNIIIFRLCFHYNRHCRVSHLFVVVALLFRHNAFSVWSLIVQIECMLRVQIYLRGENMKICAHFSFIVVTLIPLIPIGSPFASFSQSLWVSIYYHVLCKRMHKNFIRIALIQSSCAFLIHIVIYQMHVFVVVHFFFSFHFKFILVFFGFLMRSIVSAAWTTN